MADQTVKQNLRTGLRAARAGRIEEARRAFAAALRDDPNNETALLWLGYLADDPREGLRYINHAAELHVQSPRAQKALKWAWQRASDSRAFASRPVSSPVETKHRGGSKREVLVRLGFVLGLMLAAVSVGWTVSLSSQESFVLAAEAPTPTPPPAPTEIAATSTPLPTATATATASPTPLPPTPTPIPPTATSTLAPTPSLTPTAIPDSLTPTPIPPPGDPGTINEDLWIDVDLSEQALIAYEGQRPVRRFIVSTGRLYTPTPTGQFRIYVKYVTDDMAGPDYYLPAVPYVMYFYYGYGIHGTFWHDNFGTPMSHGCVNLSPSDAEWLFNWAEVGVLVNIHD